MTSNYSSLASPNAGASSFYIDSSDTQSAGSQLSPSIMPPAARAGHASGLQDSPDVADFEAGRRPSVASVTTASSQGSRASGARGGFRKLQGFFGEEFPGRDSSDTSLPASIAGKDQRSQSYSNNSRPSHRDRNHSNATDYTREASPASSRPRSPAPAPEVVPFIYQDNNVSSLPIWYPLSCLSGRLLCFRTSPIRLRALVPLRHLPRSAPPPVFGAKKKK
jgi:adenylate cyclase